MLKNLPVIFFLFLNILQAQSLYSQTFTPAGMALPGVSRGETAWCDYDNDHDLDVFITGRGEGDERISVLYRNDAGTFIDCGLSFIPVEESMVSWADFDNDDDQDLLLAGNSAYGDICLIYRNEGSFFTPIDPGLPPIQQGCVQWVDFDLDQDLDIFLSGYWITRMYRNDGLTFTDIGAGFGYFNNTAASFGDCDNDGDPDLLISGDSGAGAVTMVFINEDNNFMESGLTFPGLMSGTTDWVDYDLDGDQDMAISGYNDALEARFYLYKNSGDHFEIIYAGIEGVAIGACTWADYDNDGDPDLIMSGKASGCGAYVAGIYRNEGNDIFYKITEAIPVATRSSINWTDADNDGDFDFLISGLNISEIPYTQLYINSEGSNSYSINAAPSPPDSLQSEVTDNSVLLSWSAGTDDKTPVEGLSYNLRMGTLPGLNDIIPPMSNSYNGVRLVTGFGNTGQTKARNIMNLDPGTYFWSVQTIDGAFEGSPFAGEQSFVILPAAIGSDHGIEHDFEFAVFPNPAKDWVSVQINRPIEDAEYEITDLTGNKRLSGILDNKLIINLKGLKPALYIVTIKSGFNQKSFLVSKM